jgi:hypothetical protein
LADNGDEFAGSDVKVDPFEHWGIAEAAGYVVQGNGGAACLGGSWFGC